MEQEPKTPRERAEDLIRLLVPDWRPTPQQVVWAIRIGIFLGLLVAIGYYYEITIWDWMKLLIVPAVIAAGGLWFNRQQRERELHIAGQRSQDEALQAYLDEISQLLTDEKRPLHRARSGDRLSTVVRARTLITLTQLDGRRKGVLLRFLYESGLLNKDAPVFAMNRADLSRANLSRAALSDATMPPPLISSDALPHRGSTFMMLDMRGINLSGANLNESKLERIILRESNLSYAHLNDADLQQIWLDEADLSFANLNYAKLTLAILTRANLFAAHLNFANLRGTSLSKANLEAADLTKADLSGADLRGANLSGANLHRARLSGADLSGADLSTVILQGPQPIDEGTVQAQLEQARSLEGATMPNGQKYEDWLKSKGRVEDE